MTSPVSIRLTKHGPQALQRTPAPCTAPQIWSLNSAKQIPALISEFAHHDEHEATMRVVSSYVNRMSQFLKDLVPLNWKPSVASALSSEGLWPLSLLDEDKWFSNWPWKPSGTLCRVTQLYSLWFWDCYSTAVCPETKPAVQAVNVYFDPSKCVFSAGRGRDFKIPGIIFKDSIPSFKP